MDDESVVAHHLVVFELFGCKHELPCVISYQVRYSCVAKKPITSG